MSEFTHWNEAGRPKMVDISDKNPTSRTAIARSTIALSDELYAAIEGGQIKKEIRRKLRKLPALWVRKKQPISFRCAIRLCYKEQILILPMKKSQMAMSYTLKQSLNVMEKPALKWKH